MEYAQTRAVILQPNAWNRRPLVLNHQRILQHSELTAKQLLGTARPPSSGCSTPLCIASSGRRETNAVAHASACTSRADLADLGPQHLSFMTTGWSSEECEPRARFGCDRRKEYYSRL